MIDTKTYRMKIVFFDLETTGTKFWRNGIHQISGCIDVDGQTVEFFDFKVTPYERAEIEQEALNIAKVTKEQIMAYAPMYIVYQKFVAMLAKRCDKFSSADKYFLCGFNNASFDNQFLRAWFVQNGDKYFGSWFWSGSIDVMVLATEKLKGVRYTMPDFKLNTVCKQLGIEVDDSRLHDAAYDIELTRAAYYKCIEK